jgi:transcriptional regulator with XRE-family HTH domain
MTDEGALGTYLRDRRARLLPVGLGLQVGRRRTQGLRREEVAQRANISATWYTWLEQGRGGMPSPAVLDRIASALLLTDAEREHVFLFAFGRPPPVRYQPSEGISPRLQRLLDGMAWMPAMLRTATWDVVAWNRAAAEVLTDYATLPPLQRNLLRLTFCHPRAREMQLDWEEMAQYLVAVFRADAARAGAAEAVAPLVEELRRASPDFDRMWRDNQVRSHADSVKRLRHPALGDVALEMTSFGVDGRSDLHLLVFNPVAPKVSEQIKRLVEQSS